MLKNLLDACGGAIGFYTLGYGFAFGGDQEGRTFAGNGNFALRNFEELDYSFFFFQFAFAATAATIVAGTVAERCKMSAYLCYSFFLSAFVYPIVVHSVWDGNGFMSAFAAEEDRFNGIGMIDFAGSGVVHMVGGATALIAAIILGPRIGRFHDKDGNPLEEPKAFPPHNVALQVLGTFILWFGWYGFNPGSILIISNSGNARVSALAAVTTTLAAASGCVSSLFIDAVLDAVHTGEASYDLTAAMNGALAGLVAITAGCATVTPWCAIIIGAVGGLFYLLASKLLIKLRIDDAVDAIPVHLTNGLWGVIAAGLFSKRDLMSNAGYGGDHAGWFFEWGNGSANASVLVTQLAGAAWILGWVTFLMVPFFLVLNALGQFRVDAIEEEVGLDISHHRGAAYDLSAAKKADVEELLELRASRHGKVEVPMEVSKAAPPAPRDIDEDEA